ncbi:MAG: septation protein A [Gammaproteobacteria bacterium]
MKFLFDLFPVILFFVAFKIPDDPKQGILLATAVAIGASLLQTAWHWFKHRRLESMHLITLVLLLVLGGATLVLQDERFIKWKPTAVNWLFALAFLGSEYVGKKNLVQRMLERNVDLPPAVWTRLNASWAVFFVLMGTANLYVAFNFATETWVNFKLFGLMGLTVLFVFAQAFYLARHASPTDVEG